MRRAQAGDPAAFDELVGRYARLVLSLARTLVRHREDAEDLAQEAFLRLYRSLPRVDPTRPLEPWLVRITVNVARNLVRRRPERREDSGGTETLAERAGENVDPGQGMEDRDLRQALIAALQDLTPREREVLLLRDVQDLPTSTIAEALEISEVTVRRLSSDGRRKAQAWLRRHRPDLVGKALAGFEPDVP